MANNEQKKAVPLCTIPSSKLTIILNNFIINTVNHLNKLSVNVDEQLSEFDKKMNDLEIMTTLFESKLESLPDEIKSSFPPLQECKLEDPNPNFSSGNVNSGNEKPQDSNQNEEKRNENKESGKDEGGVKKDEDKKDEDKKDEEQKEEGEGEAEELSPQDDLQNFISKNPRFEALSKMFKYGIIYQNVLQRAKANGIDMDLFNEFYEKAKKVYPNI